MPDMNRRFTEKPVKGTGEESRVAAVIMDGLHPNSSARSKHYL